MGGGGGREAGLGFGPRAWMLLPGLPMLNAWPIDLSGLPTMVTTASHASSTKQKVR